MRVVFIIMVYLMLLHTSLPTSLPLHTQGYAALREKGVLRQHTDLAGRGIQKLYDCGLANLMIMDYVPGKTMTDVIYDDDIEDLRKYLASLDTRMDG